MSIFRETKTPYEFLIRFNEIGEVQGAHIAYLERVYKEEEIISQKTSIPLPISLGIQDGFPLQDILNEVQASVILDNENLRDENLNYKNQLNIYEKQIQTLENKILELTSKEENLKNQK